MESLKRSKYEEIGALALTVMDTIAPFDIYIKRGKSKYSKIINTNEELDLERINSYREKGVKEFYIESKSFPKYSEMVSLLGDRIAKSVSEYPAHVQVELIKELAKHTVNEISNKCNINIDTLKNSSVIVDQCINNLTENPKRAEKILALLASQPYLLKHSITTSIFSVLLAKRVGITSEKALKELGTGAMLHDCGTSQLTFDPENFDTLTREQRKEVRSHPQLGKQLFDHLNYLSREITLIILQHHEQPNGTGYPNSLKGSEIYFPAKIVGLVSSFVALISNRSFREGSTVEKALTIIKDDQGKFDSSLVSALEMLLYPNRFKKKVTASNVA